MSPNGIVRIPPLVVGVSILDITMAMAENLPSTMNGAMYHGKSAQSAGGVGRNLAESICKIYGSVNFISVIGQDCLGDILLKLMPKALGHNIERLPMHRTSSCTVIIDKDGDCKLILGDMEIHEKFHQSYISKRQELLNKAPLVIIDGNLPRDTIVYILEQARLFRIPVFFEPTDLRIAGRPFQIIPGSLTQQIRLITPNYAELDNLVAAVCPAKQQTRVIPDFDSFEKLLASVQSLLHVIHDRFDCIVVTLGQHGVVLSLKACIDPYKCGLFLNNRYVLGLVGTTKNAIHRIIFFPTPFVVKRVVNVSGAGDSFAGGFISGLLKEYTVTQSIALGFMAASKALQTAAAVPHEFFTPGYLESPLWMKRMKALTKPGNANEKQLS
uniref:Carbohydrate kinase PfkB domain-containing protein n=1 Tax=Stomoxys calcitrans TaxID=35570 RepID=A0A1I8PQD8_STOCA